MIRSFTRAVVSLFLCAATACTGDTVIGKKMSTRERNHFLHGDLVPDEAAAVAVVETVILKKSGADLLKDVQPLSAKEDAEDKEFWLVTSKSQRPFPSMVRISRIDAHIETYLVMKYLPPGSMPCPDLPVTGETL